MRIPAAVLDAAHLCVDQIVDVREESGRIVIEALRPTSFNIESLVAGITEENQHAPVETGGSVGREVW